MHSLYFPAAAAMLTQPFVQQLKCMHCFSKYRRAKLICERPKNFTFYAVYCDKVAFRAYFLLWRLVYNSVVVIQLVDNPTTAESMIRGYSHHYQAYKFSIIKDASIHKSFTCIKDTSIHKYVFKYTCTQLEDNPPGGSMICSIQLYMYTQVFKFSSTHKY